MGTQAFDVGQFEGASGEKNTILDPAQQQPSRSADERTHDAPKVGEDADSKKLTPAEEKELMSLVREYKRSWYLVRRMIVRRVLKAHEFYKGNQFTAFDWDSSRWYDAMDMTFGGQEGLQDKSMYMFETNYYKFLAQGYVAALSAQTPKSRFLPQDPDSEQDIAMAKASSTIEDIIERRNNVKSMTRLGLLYLWLAGCYFRHTRYIVDGDRAGYKKEPIKQMQSESVHPAGYICRNCGEYTDADSVAAQSQPVCKSCGNALSDADFQPEMKMEMPVVTDYEETPNGMVAQTLYSPLMVDCNPYAKDLRETEILNVELETSLASVRNNYPDKWKELEAANTTILAEAQNERLARQFIYSEQGSRGTSVFSNMVTFSRTWIQPWAFALLKDQKKAEKFKGMFPKGCLLVSAGDVVLETRESRMSDEWTWCGSDDKAWGLYPPAVGDPAISVQERINDAANMIHEYMDRLAGGLILANVDQIDTNALNNKQLLSGTLNPVKMRKGQSNAELARAIVQIRADIDPHIYEYVGNLANIAQLITGVTPQIFGGNQPGVETAAGQKQALDVALGKLGMFWQNVREEAATAAEIAVKCAAMNADEDVFDVALGPDGNYEKKLVRMSELKGSVMAFPESDQGFPMSYQEIRAFWERLMEMAEKNPFLQALFDEPANVKQAVIYTGVPGVVVPGAAQDTKTTAIINLLIKGQPIPTQVPPTMGPNGQVIPATEVLKPTIEPNLDIDDLQRCVATAVEWCIDNYRLEAEEPNGFNNVIAYIRLCRELQEQKTAKAAAQAQVAHQQSQPPQPQPQLA